MTVGEEPAPEKITFEISTFQSNVVEFFYLKTIVLASFFSDSLTCNGDNCTPAVITAPPAGLLQVWKNRFSFYWPTLIIRTENNPSNYQLVKV